MHNAVNYTHINVIIVTTYYCNMNCIYCYNNREIHERKEKISIETVRKLFEITIPFYKHIHFLWHGGEPLSLGKKFYEKIIDMQDEINIYGTEITNSIQTNLTLIDRSMAEFIVKNNIKVGSSYDGISNEQTRHCSRQILDGHNLLKSWGGHNGFIYVVQRKNIDYLIEDYEWFKKRHIGYNHNMYLASYPCEEDPLFVEPKYFAEKMCELFDYWIVDKECDIHLNYFEIVLDYILLGHKSLCCYNDCLGKHIGIRYDGSIYGCNRDMPTDFTYGNVYDYKNIRECFDSEGFNKCLSQAIMRRQKCIETCEIFGFCHGGCNNVALQKGNIMNPNIPSCIALRLVYNHIEEYIERTCKKNIEEISNVLNPVVVPYFKKILNNKC